MMGAETGSKWLHLELIANFRFADTRRLFVDGDGELEQRSSE